MGFIQAGRSLKRKKVGTSTENSKKIAKVQSIASKNLTSIDDRSILEKLPGEIVYRVFTLVGLNGNLLHMTNRYFNRMFQFSKTSDGNNWPGFGLIEEIIRVHYTFDLNSKIDINASFRKIQKYKKKLSEENFLELEHALKVFEDNQFVLSSDIFNRRFMNLRVVELIGSRKALEPEKIAREILQRSQYIKHQFKGLIEKIRNQPESELDRLVAVADTRFELGNEEENEDLDATPGVSSEDMNSYKISNVPLVILDFPERFYKGPWTSDKISMMNQMGKVLNFRYKDLDRAVVSALEGYNDKSQYKVSEFVLVMEQVSISGNYSSVESIVATFRALDRNENALIKLELRQLVRRLLLMYYGVEPNERSSDAELWVYLAEDRNVTHLNEVMEVAPTPDVNTLRLLGL